MNTAVYCQLQTPLRADSAQCDNGLKQILGHKWLMHIFNTVVVQLIFMHL